MAEQKEKAKATAKVAAIKAKKEGEKAKMQVKKAKAKAKIKYAKSGSSSSAGLVEGVQQQLMALQNMPQNTEMALQSLEYELRDIACLTKKLAGQQCRAKKGS